MSVTLSPISPRYAVSDADDPFKKYWWVILLMIAFTVLWLLAPMMGEKSVGATAIDTSKPKTDGNVEQAIAADAGDGLNLSMDGTGKASKKEEGLAGSSLYQAPPEDPAAAPTAGGAALGSASGSASLASALKKVSESPDGGWGEKAQKGFSAPRLAGGSLSGMGAASGGRSGSSGGTGAFGTSNANIGYANGSGLSGSVNEINQAAAAKGVAALKAASGKALEAMGNRSNDGARNSLNQAFDGAKAGNKIGAGGTSLGGSYAALDTAPVNLKLNDPKLQEKKIEPPAGVDSGDSSGMKDSDMAKQVAMAVATAAIGAAIGGVAGGIVSQVLMQAVQRQSDQEEKVRQQEQENHQNDQRRKLGLPAQSPST